MIRAVPHCRQLVIESTQANGVLDIILSNLQPRYKVPVVRPPAKPDVEGFGKASDHSFALALPKVAGNLDCRTRQYKDTAYRPTPDSARAVFGQMLLSVSWDQVTKASNS